MTGPVADGRLLVVATPIGNLGDLAPRAVEALRRADIVAAEDTRRTRALLSHADIPAANRLRSVRAANEADEAPALVEAIRGGATVAYVSDAGTPTVSDPGAELVRACHDAGIVVEVVPGPSALTTALAGSGLPGDRFVFEGFLPRKGAERRARLEAIATETRTVVIYESPRRVAATLTDLAAVCDPTRTVAVARELTKLHEEIVRAPLGEAADRVAENPRGEFVLVLEGGTPVEVDEETITRAVDEALARGSSARDAADRVASALGVGRRRAYEIAISRPRSR